MTTDERAGTCHLLPPCQRALGPPRPLWLLFTPGKDRYGKDKYHEENRQPARIARACRLLLDDRQLRGPGRVRRGGAFVGGAHDGDLNRLAVNRADPAPAFSRQATGLTRRYPPAWRKTRYVQRHRGRSIRFLVWLSKPGLVREAAIAPVAAYVVETDICIQVGYILSRCLTGRDPDVRFWVGCLRSTPASESYRPERARLRKGHRAGYGLLACE